MDAHYHQVMNQREKITSTGTRKYFAYSTILDQDAFKEWAQQHSYQFFSLPTGKVAVLEDTDLVFNFPSRWWGGLVAGLENKSGSQVYGLVFDIPEKEWPIVQHKEGFITGMCIETPVTAIVNGEKISATAFVTNPQRAQTSGTISKNFIKALLQGAKASGLPEKYIQKLESYLA
jgi:gamma-glutamylcyclotransferase